MKRPSLILGIMSGTSLDGVDCVLTSIDSQGRSSWVRNWARRLPFGLKRRLLACASGKSRSWECGQLHHDLGRFYARVAQACLGSDRIDAVGLHGQTMFHRSSGRAPATWQIGEPAYLAEALRVPVVSNFRAADMAAGGEGAPLATLFHVRVFAERGRHVCVQNVGGIGNVTSIDWKSGTQPTVLAFDTGPGNLLMDGAVGRLSQGRLGYDRDGRWAAAGTAHALLVRRWLRHAFIRRPPPKSTGREAFGEAFLEGCWAAMDVAGLGREDRVATLLELTVQSVTLNYRLHLPSLPDRVIVAGGGARNPVLMARLSTALGHWGTGLRPIGCGTLGWPVEAVEGGAFALLAWERLRGRPGNLPETTGAARAVLCGQVTEA